MNTKLFWNSIIAFLINQYQPLFMLSLVNFYNLRSFTTIDNFCGIFAITMAILTVSLMVLSTIILKLKNANLLRDNVYEETFSILTQELSLKGATGTYWKVLILLRWTLVSSVLVFLRNNSDFQIIINLILSGLYTYLMLNNPPYSDPRQNKIMLFNELMTSAYIYTLFAMTDFNLDYESKE